MDIENNCHAFYSINYYTYNITALFMFIRYFKCWLFFIEVKTPAQYCDENKRTYDSYENLYLNEITIVLLANYMNNLNL